jgi:transposase
MDAVEQLKEDLRNGRFDPERLLAVVISLQRQLLAAQQRIAELERNSGPSPPTNKVDQPFSLRAEEQRQKAQGKSGQKRPGRKPLQLTRKGRLHTADKLTLAIRTEKCLPANVSEADCTRSHTRPVWRLENGQAVVVAYEICRGPKNQYGSIPGVLGRSEFGIEIVLEIAYFVYVQGLSFDKVCRMLNFLQNLRMGKTQADALLRQLAKHWQGEFDVLCTLLAHSAVVHADETSWSIKSVWAFLSEKARLLFFGVNKDAATLEQILDPATFAGLLVSDDAAVYANFSQAQKCWAHLLRKAIKLTLQEPTNDEYRRFLDSLLEIYRRACRVQRDGRMGPAGRAKKVAELDDAILDLCGPLWALELPPLAEGPENDYRLLTNEVMRLMLDQELFRFVTAPATTQPNGTTQPAPGTNNEAERTLRGPALARKTGQTNRSPIGARRQTIVVSVLQSLRLYLPDFTLADILAEVGRWREAGKSCFRTLLEAMKLRVPTESVLDRLLPSTDG